VLTLAAAGAGALLLAFVAVYSGIYNVAATEQHMQWTYSALETAMRQSVRLRARKVTVPSDLDDHRRVVRGALCFRDKCVQCHGAPGVAQGDIGKGMQPLPGPLVDALQRWNARELYWVTRNGIRMSGMPAWEFRLADDDLWDLVALLQRLPRLSAQDYQALTVQGAVGPGPQGSASCGAAAGPPPTGQQGGDVRRGARALYQYACAACHTIPGIAGSRPHVGPPLEGMARRALIAGKLANTPDNMVRWLRHTREVDPLSAMPEMGVGEQDARDMAAYLSNLH
jgi:mono/diheme cytochrome c family protein